ncbi:Hypothetical protein NTJ_04115 [Nesidiocoris tenuis]|uniref:Thymidine kinase n=1 Tax=Nesidiocoris tenuis TaxID=355587 RepID=A0ABN7AJ72_9HEMI|nr:Hypothetical protein NTJ_04115 [Nesidiocoris tenuis]
MASLPHVSLLTPVGISHRPFARLSGRTDSSDEGHPAMDVEGRTCRACEGPVIKAGRLMSGKSSFVSMHGQQPQLLFCFFRLFAIGMELRPRITPAARLPSSSRRRCRIGDRA